jgi:hydrogenase-4 component B
MLGFFHVALAVVAVAGVALLWRRVRQGGLRRGPTWDCGYAAPTPRMQYTAGSFAGIVTEWFSWILRPQRSETRPMETFPARAHFEEHTPETVLEYGFEPAGRLVMRLSNAARRLQRGRSQAYLLYLAVCLVALGAIVLWGAAP